MKFSIAAAAIAATSSFVGVHASTSTSKSGKGSCSSSPKLEKFCYEEPANFEGAYNTCYSSALREAATGYDPPGTTGVFHFCLDGEGRNGELGSSGDVFKKLDEYGAYEAITTGSLTGVQVGQWKFQGIAQGNTIKMTSFGGGAVNATGDVILPNETPDTQECTLYDEGILKCMNYFEEYCGPNTATNAFFPFNCEVGEWLMSYTIETVSVLEGSECPPAPAGFCDNYVPGRKLQEEEKEEEDNEAIPCPFLNKNMN